MTTARTCSGCPRELGLKNRSGRCRSCAAHAKNADPAFQAARRAGVHRKFADPAYRATCAARLIERNRNPSPERLEQLRQQGHAIWRDNLKSPEMMARLADPALKAENGRKRTATVLAWCPPEYREQYLHLLHGKRLLAREARALIEADIATAERRRLAAMTPFERQLERVRNGAALVAKPVLRRPDPAFTLGGVSSGAI